MNTHLLVCDPAHSRVDYRHIEFLTADPACPDMVYTANAAVVRCGRAVLAKHLDYDYEVVPLRTMSAQWYDSAIAVINDLHTVAYDPRALDEPNQCRCAGSALYTTELRKGGGVRCTALTLDDALTVGQP